MTNATGKKAVTEKELTQAFEGKHVNVSYGDFYGIVVSVAGGTIELEDGELWISSRDNQDNVTGSICICGDAIEAIEEEGGKYYIVTKFDMPNIEIEECNPAFLEKIRATREKQ